MNVHLVRTAMALAALCATLPSAAHDADSTAGKLGKVHFKVCCNAAAQREFDLAMAYYHSFAWEQIKAPLDRALQADGACGMAHWLRALASLDNPFVWPGNVSAKTLADGAALIDQARKTGLATQRERDYVDALAVFFQDADKLNHRTRAKALESRARKRRHQVPRGHARRPSSIAWCFRPTSTRPTSSTSNQLRAAKLLEPIFAKQPEHPGAAHYLIHSYDYPPLAAQGLPAAQRYSKIAPAAAHAQHMPSHIFTRVGAWSDSVAANTASAKADTAAGPQHAARLRLHGLCPSADGAGPRGAAASATARSAIAKPPDHFAAAYAYAAIPARLALERGDWAAAAKLPLTPSGRCISVGQVPAGRSEQRLRPRAGCRGPARWPRRSQSELARLSACGIGRPSSRSATGSSRSTSRSTWFAALPPSRRVRCRPASARPAAGRGPRGREREARRDAGADAAGARDPRPGLARAAATQPARCASSKPCCARSPNRLRALAGVAVAAERSRRRTRRRATTPTRSRGRPRRPTSACRACSSRGSR